MFLEETKVVTCGDGLCFLLDFGSHVLCPFLLGFWDQPDAAVQSKLCILTYFRSTTTRKCALSETWFAHCQQCTLRKYRSVLSLFLYIFLAIFSSCSWRKKKKERPNWTSEPTQLGCISYWKESLLYFNIKTSVTFSDLHKLSLLKCPR